MGRRFGIEHGLLSEDFRFQTRASASAWKLDGMLWPYAVAWLGDQRLAVLAHGVE